MQDLAVRTCSSSRGRQLEREGRPSQFEGRVRFAIA